MKLIAWLSCWPLLMAFAVLAFVTDSLIDVCEAANEALERLEDYVDAP
jgi:hypothetical protein